MKIILLLTTLTIILVIGTIFETPASAQYQSRSGQFQGTRIPVNGTTYTDTKYGVQVSIPDGWSGVEIKRTSGATTVMLTPGGFQSASGGQHPPVTISLSIMPKDSASQDGHFMPRRMMDAQSCTNSTSTRTVINLTFDVVTIQCIGNAPIKSESYMTQTSLAYVTLGLRADSSSDFDSKSTIFDSMLGTLEITNANNSSQNVVIPSWVKKNANYWSTGIVGDADFVAGIQYLIQQGIMKVPQTTSTTNSSSNQIPTWIKTNAGWWANGQISDDDFIKGIQYLVANKIMKVS